MASETGADKYEVPLQTILRFDLLWWKLLRTKCWMLYGICEYKENNPSLAVTTTNTITIAPKMSGLRSHVLTTHGFCRCTNNIVQPSIRNASIRCCIFCQAFRLSCYVCELLCSPFLQTRFQACHFAHLIMCNQSFTENSQSLSQTSS